MLAIPAAELYKMLQLWPVRPPCTTAGCEYAYALVLLVASALGSLIVTALVSDLAVSLPSGRANPGHELSRVEQVIALNAQKYIYPPGGTLITPAVEDIPVAEIWAQAQSLDAAEQVDLTSGAPAPTLLALSGPAKQAPAAAKPIELELPDVREEASAPSMMAATPQRAADQVTDGRLKKVQRLQRSQPALVQNPGKSRPKRVQVARAAEQPRKTVAIEKLRKADRVQMVSSDNAPVKPLDARHSKSRRKEPATGDVIHLTLAGQWPRS
jgi:hypothetical protein